MASFAKRKKMHAAAVGFVLLMLCVLYSNYPVLNP